MTTKKLLSLQLKRLLSSVAEHGHQHLGQIEADLIQTNFLLAEAIRKLNAGFMAMHTSICLQQEIVTMLLTETADDGRYAARLDAVSAEMGAHVNAAVTSLQFEDMTSQLIGRALQRIAGLDKVLETLGAGSSGMRAETGIEDIVARLSDVNRLLEQQSGKLESDLWKAVCQTHMESGDIELF